MMLFQLVWIFNSLSLAQPQVIDSDVLFNERANVKNEDFDDDDCSFIF